MDNEAKVCPDDDTLMRIGAAFANMLWAEMDTEQIEDLVDYDRDPSVTLWETLRSWAVTTVLGNIQMRYLAFMHDPPDDQMNAQGSRGR